MIFKISKVSSYILITCTYLQGDYEEAVKCHEKYLAVGVKTSCAKDQDRAYKELGTVHKSLGNLQQALVCFEKRLVVAHDLVHPSAKGSAYGELGEIHSLLGNHEQAVSCLDQQLAAARETGDRSGEARAAGGLGTAHQRAAEWTTALHYHRLDLQISRECGDQRGEARALASLAETHEAMARDEPGEKSRAREFAEQLLRVAAEVDDSLLKIKAFETLGRLKESAGELSEAATCLRQGLTVAEQGGRREEEARLRQRLGMTLWRSGDSSGAQVHLEVAASLLESARREARSGAPDRRMALFDLQTRCYQALQAVLVSLGRENEALVAAERAKCRALGDLRAAYRKSGASGKLSASNRNVDDPPSSIKELEDLVDRQKSAVLYFSLAAGHLYSWLIVPTRGGVKFYKVVVIGNLF